MGHTALHFDSDGHTHREMQIELCRQVVAWCNAQKRTFLRQRIESRLAALLFEQVGEIFAWSGRMCVIVVVRDGSIGRQLLMSHVYRPSHRTASHRATTPRP